MLNASLVYSMSYKLVILISCGEELKNFILYNLYLVDGFHHNKKCCREIIGTVYSLEKTGILRLKA